MSPLTVPAASASEAARTLHELARLGELDRTGNPAPVVIGDLRSAVLSMRQIVDQLAFAHTSPAIPAAARADALATADELHQSGTILDDLLTRLDAAEQAADQVTTVETSPAREWVTVASLHGDHATEALELLEEEGPEGAVVFCSQWDSGIDTDDEAIEARRTRAHLPLAAGDQAVTVDAYTLVTNPSAGQVAMYRLIDDRPSMAIIEAQDRLTTPTPETPTPTAPAHDAQAAPGSHPAPRSRAESRPPRTASGGSWFDPPATGGASQRRGPSL